MPLKQTNKSKDSEEKIMKRKTTTILAKIKDASIDKGLKKNIVSSAKKGVKIKTISKKIGLKSGIKYANVKTPNTLSIEKILVDKEEKLKNKKEIQQKANNSEKRVSVVKSEVLKGIVKVSSEIVKNKFKGVILINELITVRKLADKMKLGSSDVLKKLLLMGSLATINQRLDVDTAVLLANEFGYDTKLESIYFEEKNDPNFVENPSKLKTRPPVVTIMGHVDHGKTSLLDSIRSSNVVGGEHGGITQHIGAYKVKTQSGHYISFLDTPGHEAFTAMRSRGVQVTDIVILVVSATDGVMPQTVEAINHAKAAKVSIIVAVNKIDLPSADSQKIRQELSNYGLVPEEWGGDTIVVDISAKEKINIDSLLEMILLKAEMMELKANPDKNAAGVVIEAMLDSRKGSVATLLIQSGSLKVGDNLVVGTTYGKVRAIVDEHGKRLNIATPSSPVGILGINEPPQAGDKFIVVECESRAREIAQAREIKARENSLKSRHHLTLADISTGQAKDLRIILKTDVQGSLGALSGALERLSGHGISLKIIHKGAGAITSSDVALAVASDALIIGFNLRPDSAVEKLAELEMVSINVYRIIYDLIADVKSAMEGLLAPDMKEKIFGKASVKQVFKLSSYGTISGCSVVDGMIKRGTKIRLLRDNIIVFEGNISSLKRFKNDVKEVEKGYECGIGLENFSDIKTGDIIENFTMEKIIKS
ncbi:MAG: translation initiation factor IF-2 [Endomicrobium sp.]|jgi:translation initiation factor IF-2|nr:translation initiation factor IF-2 [Endomicrobium sp.]